MIPPNQKNTLRRNFFHALPHKLAWPTSWTASPVMTLPGSPSSTACVRAASGIFGIHTTTRI